MKETIKKLSEVQRKLNAPKGQFNSFGKYHYRSCEDILMAVKPLLDGLVITINDQIEVIGDRIYVKATATFSDGENSISSTAYAREPETKKGCDDSQITGATSSYARKYALNGLLLIDDNKDADHDNNKQDASNKQDAPLKKVEPLNVAKACSAIFNAPTLEVAEKYASSATERASNEEERSRIANALENRKANDDQKAAA